jgi:hypothetical protein
MAILGMFSGKSTHPLADAKEARASLARLTSMPAIDAVEDISAWLEPLPGIDDLKLEQRADIALLLDETGAAHARRLARDYLNTPRSARGKGARLWASAHGYWHKLTLAYSDCLARLADNPKGLSAQRLALLSMRLLHAHGVRCKWQQFRYGPIDAALWADVGRVYLQATAGKLADNKMRLYANAPEDSSAELEYLKLLVFHASSMDKLLPLEIELAERLIAWFLPHFVLTTQVRPENVYWVDAAKALPPTRLAKLPEIAPSLRFFSTGEALTAVDALKARIERSKEVPADLPLGGQYPVVTVATVLNHLAICWAPKPPMRASDRHRVQTMLAVIHDMAEIQLRLSGEAGRQEGETWVAENISHGGMAARMALGSNDWLQVGALIGMRPERSEQWMIGVVRRFAKESESQGVVGIETIGKSPRGVEIFCSGIRNQAILLETPLREGEIVTMVVPDQAWEDFMPVTFTLDNQSAQLLPFGISYQGADFLVGRYRVDRVA